MQKRLTLFYLSLAIIAGFSAAAPARSQSLLDRLENRVRERLGGEQTPQPTAPPNLQAPPLRPGSEAPPADAAPRLGLEAEERGAGPPYEVVVNGVRPGTPAAAAGLQTGDVILSADGRRVGEIGDISAVLETKRGGDDLRLGIRRGDAQLEVQVLFAAPRAAESSAATGPEGIEGPGAMEGNPRRPAVVDRPPSGSGRIGVTVENPSTTPPGAGVPVRRGAVVVAVAPGSPAEVLGIQPGNVIVAIDGRIVQSAAGLIEEIGATVPGQQIEISFYRGESLMRMPLRLAGADGLAAGAAAGEAPAATPGGARLGPPSGVAGGAGAASAPPTGLLGGLGQAIGGMFGGAAAPSAAVPGSGDSPTNPNTTNPNTTPPDAATPDAATPDDLVPPPADLPPADVPPASGPPASGAPASGAPQQAPASSGERPPFSAPPESAPSESAGPLTPVPSSEPSAPPAGAFAAPPMETSVRPEAAETELVPLPAEGPDEIRQLLDKIQAMQRRIDVLERRLAELEAERSQP